METEHASHDDIGWSLFKSTIHAMTYVYASSLVVLLIHWHRANIYRDPHPNPIFHLQGQLH